MMAELVRDSDGVESVRRWQPRVLQSGMTLCDRYRIRRFLGMGAMGEVHEAEDLLLGKSVAIKTLNARSVDSERAIARLKREVAAAHAVTHPNVCRIFDLGIDCGGDTVGPLTFITMEFIEGRTLASLIPDPGVTDQQRTDILRQLAAGLSAAHGSGVIHRDLKPENVMVSRRADGTLRAVITDFGLAGSELVATDVGSGTGLSGTRAYAAPERLLGCPATRASDVYGFGLIAREVLLRRRFVGPHPDLRHLPLPWRALIGCALTVDPAARPKHAAELLARLDGGRGRGRLVLSALSAAALVAVAAMSFSTLGDHHAALRARTSGQDVAPRFELVRDDTDVGGSRAPAQRMKTDGAAPATAFMKQRRPSKRHGTPAPAAAAPTATAGVSTATVSPTLPATPDSSEAPRVPDPLVRDVPFEPSSTQLLNPF